MQNTTAVVVLGMHRSGTSALAGALALLGVDMGRSLLAPADDNVRGFWEHEELVRLHDRLLSAFESSWDDVCSLPDSWWTDERIGAFRNEVIRIIERDFSSTPAWGIKDPRLCKLIPFWMPILEEQGCECRFILTHRHPIEVAHSLKNRDRFDTAKSGLLWLQHNLLAEKWTRGKTRIFTSYERLLADPEAVSLEIAELIGDPSVAPSENNTKAIRNFVTPEFRHHTNHPVDWMSGFEAYGALIEEALQTLSAACRGARHSTEETFDQLGKRLDELTSTFDPIQTAHIRDLEVRIANLQNIISQIKSSPSWRETKPPSGVKKLMLGIGRALTPK